MQLFYFPLNKISETEIKQLRIFTVAQYPRCENKDISIPNENSGKKTCRMNEKRKRRRRRGGKSGDGREKRGRIGEEGE